MDPQPRPGPRWHTWLVWLVAVLMTAAGTQVLAGYYRLGPVDDAYISLRYAANWAAGRGLVFNPGEQVEGYTNFLLVLLEAGAIRAGLKPVLAMVLIGRLALAALGGLVAVFVYRHVLPGRGGLAVAAGLLVVLNPIVTCWGVSGMESGLAAVLVLATLLAAVGGCSTGRAGAAGAVLTLLAMTRPEAVVLLVPLLLVVRAQMRSWRPAVVCAAVFVVAFGVYFALRAWHFGYLLPNTFYAKLDYGGVLLARRGLLYAWDFVAATPAVWVLSIVTVVLLRRAALWARAGLLFAAFQVAATIYMGGDHFALFRFLVPTVPLLALVALCPAALAVSEYGLRDRRGVAAVLVSLLLLGATDVAAARLQKRGEPPGTSQWRRFVAECRLAEQWGAIGQWLRPRAAPDASVCTLAIGAVGFHSDLRIVDPVGLIDPAIAHQRRTLGAGHAGHEKFDVQRVLAQRPAYILVLNLLTRAPVPHPVLRTMDLGAFGAQLLADPALDRAYRYESIPFTREATLYLNVFVRRDLPPLACADLAPPAAGTLRR